MWVYVLGALIVVYIGMPALLYWPIFAVFGGVEHVPHWLLIPLYPHLFVQEYFSAYNTWMDLQGKLLGMGH